MTVAVIDFTNQTSSANWWNGDGGNQLADVLSNELSSTGDFKIVERQKIDAVQAEQDPARSSRTRPGSGPHTGRSPAPSAPIPQTLPAPAATSYRRFPRSGGKSEAYAACTMVKRDGCEACCRQKEQQHRDSAKKALDLDG